MPEPIPFPNPAGTHTGRAPTTAQGSDAQAVITEKNPGIYLAFPAYGGKIDSPFAIAVMLLMHEADLVVHMDVMNGDSLVNRARNKLAMNFLNGFPATKPDGSQVRCQCEWLLFLDTDLIFQASDIRLLYQTAVKRGPNIYCGTYPIKQLKPKVVFNQLEGARPDADGVLEVRESGTGYMLIHRSVFEKMIEKYADLIRYEADAGSMSKARAVEYDFFSVGVAVDPVYKYKRFLSEDWYFCQRWRECGGKVLIHTKIQAQHIGQMTYPVNTADIMETALVHAAALNLMRKAQGLSLLTVDEYVNQGLHRGVGATGPRPLRPLAPKSAEMPAEFKPSAPPAPPADPVLAPDSATPLAVADAAPPVAAGG